MQSRELPHSADADRQLTDSAGLDRLLDMMVHWWAGWSLDWIAREHDVRRQRVAALLARVDCTRVRWSRADHDRPDSRRRVHAVQIARARAALLHPGAHRLTARQRAALAWQASGLALVDIARRMGTTPQNVRNLQVAARWRLDRLSRIGADQAEGSATGVADLDWSEIVQGALPPKRTTDACLPDQSQSSGSGAWGPRASG